MNKRDLLKFHAQLLTWYQHSGRHHLPWRNTRDPYAILLSELMLQQTQVGTVLARFYHPFLARFPTLQSLANAELADVLKAWEGLGYYQRARNLHRTAQLAAPHLPTTVEALLALPGIGRNTAHAVAAFAHDEAVPVMEANVLRVLHRIMDCESATDAQCWQWAHTLLDTVQPYAYNQAMMDLGATLCTPRAPACGQCPARSICQGQYRAEMLPKKRVKAALLIRTESIIVVESSDGKLFAAPRKERFLQGLFAFNSVSADTTHVQIGNALFPLDRTTMLGAVDVTYSHFHLHANVYHLRLPNAHSGPHWHTRAQLPQLAWSRAENRIMEMLPPSENRKFSVSKKFVVNEK